MNAPVGAVYHVREGGCTVRSLVELHSAIAMEEHGDTTVRTSNTLEAPMYRV